MTSTSAVNGPRAMTRRGLLQAAGAAIALPWLESLVSGQATGDQPPLRLAFLYVPNGMHMPDWTPSETGDSFQLPSILQPLADYQAKMTVLSGLTLNGARALGDGGGDHARSVAAFLTSAHPKKTDGADIRNGVSVDQVAAAEVGHHTRLASLELGLERSAQAGRCDSGYSCVYTSNMSWRTPTSPVAKEVDPAAVFDRLFGAAGQTTLQNRTRQDRYKTSILDLVQEQAQSLQNRLGGTDRQKLDEYLYAVRDIEQRIARGPQTDPATAAGPQATRPPGIPDTFAAHARLMFDLIALAFQTDVTRIATFMYTNAGSNRSYPEIDVPDGHHNLSHHGNDPAKLAKISKINHYHTQLLAHLLARLDTIQEGQSSLLDNCLVMYGSGIGDGNRHNHDNLPIVLLGKGRSSIRSGRHLKYPRNTPLANLYVSLLQRMDVPTTTFGDSTGPLDDLA